MLISLKVTIEHSGKEWKLLERSRSYENNRETTGNIQKLRECSSSFSMTPVDLISAEAEQWSSERRLYKEM